MLEKILKNNALRETLIVFAAALLTLPFIYPFLQSQQPASGDGLLQLFRTIALEFSVRNGDLWPRFAPAFHFGFGGPNFNYYSPLSYYLPVFAYQLLDLSFIQTFNLSVVTYAIIAAIGAYQLGRAWGGSGVLTAVAFVYAPPYFSTWDRFGQLLAWALVPWLLWALWRLAHSRSRINFALVALLFIALLLSHNITSVVVAVFVVAYVLFLSFRSDDWLKTGLFLVAALGVGVVLTAFFWLPALVEQEFVQLNRLDIERFDFRNNFVPVTQMIMPGEAISLGIPQLVLAMLGLGAALLVDSCKQWRPVMLLLLGCVGGAVFLASRASLWVWETAPLLSIVLFPQRFMFAAGLFLALMAGISAVILLERVNRSISAPVVAALAGVMMLYALPVMQIGYLTEDELDSAETIRDLHTLERAGYLGATSNGEFLPVWVEKTPDSWQLTDRFYTDDNIARLFNNNRVTVESQEWGLKSVDLTIAAEEDTTLRFEWFYFPGWQARVGEARVEPYPIDEEGFLAVDVPAGENDVRVFYGVTPIRRMGLIVSGIGVVMLAGLFWRLPFNPTAIKLGRVQPLVIALTLLVTVGVLLVRIL